MGYSLDNIVIIVLVAIIVLLILAIIVLDIINRKKNQNSSLENDDLLLDEEEKKELLAQSGEKGTVLSCNEFDVNQEKNESISEKVDMVPKAKPIEEIKYVEENDELEKTKAKIELESLKEELMRQEEERIRDEAIKENITLEVKESLKAVEPTVLEPEKAVISPEAGLNNDVVEPTMQDLKTIVATVDNAETVNKEKIEVAEIAGAIDEQIKKEEAAKEANLVRVNEVQEDLNELLEMGINEKITLHEDEQEEKAILSVEQFDRISDEVYDSNEVVQNAYLDEGEEPISLQELENLYNTREMKTVKLDNFTEIDRKTETPKIIIDEKEIKKMEDLPPIALDKKFKSSPFISPVYGISKTKESIELEQTANLDKLNEEIKKTNEFLKTLKELQKNLD